MRHQFLVFDPMHGGRAIDGRRRGHVAGDVDLYEYGSPSSGIIPEVKPGIVEWQDLRGHVRGCLQRFLGSGALIRSRCIGVVKPALSFIRQNVVAGAASFLEYGERTRSKSLHHRNRQIEARHEFFSDEVTAFVTRI